MKSEITVLLLTGVLLAACAPSPVREQPSLPWTYLAGHAGTKLLARVNGIAITEAMLQAFRNRPGTRKTISDDQALQALIELVILAQQQNQSNTVQAQLALAELNTLATRAIGDIVAQADLSEAAARRQYEAGVASHGYVEYRLARIVLPSKQAAERLLPNIRVVPDFGMAAAHFSLDSKSGRVGGEIGWKQRGSLPKAIQAILPKMQKGIVYPEPIAVNGQWQLLLLKGMRHLKPPPFDSVKTGIASKLKRDAIRAQVDRLRKQAEVEIFRRP